MGYNLQSILMISSSVIPSKLVPAFNISKAYVVASTPAIGANTRTASLSLSVVVGLVKFKVSERIPEIIIPAIFCGIST